MYNGTNCDFTIPPFTKRQEESQLMTPDSEESTQVYQRSTKIYQVYQNRPAVYINTPTHLPHAMLVFSLASVFLFVLVPVRRF